MYPIKQQIERMCSRDFARPVLNQVHLNAERERLEASNEHAIAIVPVETHDDVGGMIHPGALQAARKKNSTLSARADEVEVVETGDTGPRMQASYPNMQPPIDALKNNSAIGVPGLCLDAALLHRLARAITTETPFVRIYLPHHAWQVFEVLPTLGDAQGIMMPVQSRYADEWDLRPLVTALETGGEIDRGMRAELGRLLGVEVSDEKKNNSG